MSFYDRPKSLELDSRSYDDVANKDLVRKFYCQFIYIVPLQVSCVY